MGVPPRSLSALAQRLPELDGVEPIDVAEAFRDLPGLALFDSARFGLRARWSFLTADPLAVVDAAAPGPDPLAEARTLLERMVVGGTCGEAPEPPFRGGLCGFMGYDFGRRFETKRQPVQRGQSLPELRLGLHDWVLAWNRATGRAWLCGVAVDGDEGLLAERLALARDRAVLGGTRAAASAGGLSAPSSTLQFHSEMSETQWSERIESIRGDIARGELYQANLSRRLSTPFDRDPWPRYRALSTREPGAFAAYLDLGLAPGGTCRAILSASPESFVSISQTGVVATSPIKGTRRRGATRPEDVALARELLQSAKDRAENTMIVDVLRNDLGRVCRPGSVCVPRLVRLERTATVQHLVSTITGRLAHDCDQFDVLAATFPGGSVTGAPKIRAMELLGNLEPVARGPYSGAAVWMGPDGAMGSSLLIRTFVTDGQLMTLHVGGGITWRSDPHAEWQETIAKARGPLAAIGGEASGESFR